VRSDPVPGIVLGFLAKILTALGLQEAVVGPELDRIRTLSGTETRARRVKEAADSSERGSSNCRFGKTSRVATGSSGGPLGYSEASPYEWTARPAEAVRYGR